MQKVLVIFAHPALHKSKIHRKLAEVARTVKGVTFHNLYDAYPDFYINAGEEQRLLTEHDILVWEHPLYWYSCPALLKEWIDVVLAHNFAFGHKGTFLKGKRAISAVSTGGGTHTYSGDEEDHYTIAQFLAPFHQTARHCGMEYLPPFVVHGSHLLKEPEIGFYGDQYRRLLTALANDTLYDWKSAGVQYINELI